MPTRSNDDERATARHYVIVFAAYTFLIFGIPALAEAVTTVVLP
ncbi:hypothetical protein [Microbacterium allomyrinae]|nr:hypothetical protein [Microbacterium allomyrinae]